MNHCDKVLYNVEAHDVGKTEPTLGGVIEEFLPVPSVAVALRATPKLCPTASPQKPQVLPTPSGTFCLAGES